MVGDREMMQSFANGNRFSVFSINFVVGCEA